MFKKTPDSVTPDTLHHFMMTWMAWNQSAQTYPAVLELLGLLAILGLDEMNGHPRWEVRDKLFTGTELPGLVFVVVVFFLKIAFQH